MKKIILLLLIFNITYTNAQTTWNVIPTGTDKNLLCVDFPSILVGYIGGEDSTLLKTIDGGKTWNPVIFSGIETNPGGEDILHIQFLTDDLGYLTIGPYGHLYKTIDGGLYWTNMLPASSLCYVNGLYLFEEDSGFVAGSGCFTPEEFMSIGSPMAVVSYPFTTDWYGQIVDIDFNEDLGMAISSKKGLFRTEDRGITWDTVHVGVPDDYVLTSIEVVNETLAYAGYAKLGSGFGVLWSVDGGLTWEMETASATFAYPTYNDVKSANNGDIYTAGESGFTSGIIQEKIGDDWTYTDVPQIINGIDSYESDITWCVGDNGYVVVNQDPGLLSIDKDIVTIEIDIYPNPVIDVINITSSSSISNSSVSVYDLTGKIFLYSENINRAIDVSTLPEGVYILTVNMGSSLHSKRFIKTN